MSSQVLDLSKTKLPWAPFILPVNTAYQMRTLTLWLRAEVGQIRSYAAPGEELSVRNSFHPAQIRVNTKRSTSKPEKYPTHRSRRALILTCMDVHRY